MKYAISIAVLVLSSALAFADTAPGQDKVEATLKAQGYKSWKSIVLDNGVWEVDDAINSAGKQFDLRIDAKTLKTVSSVAE